MDDLEGGTTGIMEDLLHTTGIFFDIVFLVSLVAFVAAVCYLFSQPRNQPNRNLLLWTLILRLLLAAHAVAAAYLPLYTSLSLVMVYQEMLRVPLLFVTLYAAARYRKTMSRKERRAFLCISLVYWIAVLEVVLLLLSLVSIPFILALAFPFS